LRAGLAAVVETGCAMALICEYWTQQARDWLLLRPNIYSQLAFPGAPSGLFEFRLYNVDSSVLIPFAEGLLRISLGSASSHNFVETGLEILFAL
jgi:hypothetical protein